MLDKVQEYLKKSNITIQELLNKKKNLIPLSIFATKISPATALVKYLKDERNYSYAQIAHAINRDQRTIWTLYNKAKTGKNTKIIVKDCKYFLPISIFQNRSFSFLENIVKFLIKNHNLKPKQIANLLGRKSSTIYSIVNRIKTKKQKTSMIKLKP